MVYITLVLESWDPAVDIIHKLLLLREGILSTDLKFSYLFSSVHDMLFIKEMIMYYCIVDMYYKFIMYDWSTEDI